MKKIIQDIKISLENSNNNFINIKDDNITNRLIKKIIRYKLDRINISELLSEIKCGTIDSLQGIGCDFVIFSNVSESFNENELRSSFEFNPNRINVLWSRTKKHFIHIISDKYWTNKEDINNSFYATRFQAEVTSKNNINRICLNVDDFNNLNFEKIFNSKQYDFANKIKISEIGKYGEMILDNVMQDEEMREILIGKIYDDICIELSKNFEYHWLNKNTESYNEYDYLLKSNNKQYFLDVKASIKNSNDFYISENEFNFIRDNIERYIVLKINDISKYNINLKNKSCLSFVIKNISSYLYDEKLRRFRNLKSDLFYKLRE